MCASVLFMTHHCFLQGRDCSCHGPRSQPLPARWRCKELQFSGPLSGQLVALLIAFCSWRAQHVLTCATAEGALPVLQDLLKTSMQIPFSVPPYMSLLARSVATLEGIALMGDPQYQMVAQVSIIC